MELYRTVLPQAMRITWRHRPLWILALAMTWVSTLAEPELMRRSLDLGNPGVLRSLGRGVVQTGLLSARGLAQALVAVRDNPLGAAKLAGVAVVLLAAALALTWVSMVAQGALVSGVAYAAAGRSQPFGRSWALGRRKFWPVLALNAGVKIAVMGVFGALWAVRSLPPFIFTPLFVLGGLAVLWLFTWLKFAVAATVLEDRPLRSAVLRSRTLLHRRWTDHLALAGMLSLATAVAIVLLLVAVLLALMPFLLVLGVARLLDFTAGAQLYFYLSWLTLAALAALAAIFVTALHWSAWTLAFVHAATQEIKSVK